MSKSVNKKWISTYSNHWSEPGIYIEFSDKDSLYISRDLNFDNIQKHKYFIDSINTLILDDSLIFGQIIKHTDNILIIKDSLSTKTFIPIIDYKIKTDINKFKKILLSDEWYIKENGNIIRIEFKNDSYYYNPSKIKMYNRITESKGWESFEYEKWSIEKYKNSIFLILSFWQFDYQVYQIKNITDTSIVTETCWTDSLENIVFSIQKKLSNDDYKKYQDFLIGTWQLIEFEETIDSSEIFEEIIPITRNHRIRPFADKDSVPMILYKYFKNNSIIYTFNPNGDCLMNAKKLNLRTGNWKLSKDGKYIQIENGWMRTMRVISISDSILVTERSETIEYEDRYDWTEKYIREKLRKIE